MAFRTDPKGPSVLAVSFGNLQIVDACEAPSHQALHVEFPVFIPVRAKPLAAGVVPLVGKAYGDAIAGKGPDLLD